MKRWILMWLFFWSTAFVSMAVVLVMFAAFARFATVETFIFAGQGLGVVGLALVPTVGIAMLTLNLRSVRSWTATARVIAVMSASAGIQLIVLLAISVLSTVYQRTDLLGGVLVVGVLYLPPILTQTVMASILGACAVRWVLVKRLVALACVISILLAAASWLWG